MANLSNINNKFLVTTGGNVLIGQTAAVGTSKLQVTGNATFAGNVGVGLTADSNIALFIKANGNTYITGNIVLEDADSTTKSAITHVNGGLYLSHDASTDDLALTSGNATFSGNVTANGIYTAGNSVIIYKAQRNGGAVAGDWSYDDATTDMSLGTSTAHSFSLKTGNTRALTINSSQNVGIGTASPNEKLQLAGNLNAYAPGGIDAGLFASTAAGSTTIALRSSGITHFNGGNVGIGTTSPAARLDVRNAGQGGIELWPEGLAVAGTNLINNYDRTGDNFVDFEIRAAQYNWKIGTSSKMVMLSSGNVGIGTTSPTATLQVNGDIKIGSGGGSGTDSNNMSIQVSNATYGDTANLGLLVRNNGTNGQFAQIGFGYSESKCPVVIGSVITDGGGATKGDFIIGTRSTTTGSDAPTEKMRIGSDGSVTIGSSTLTGPRSLTLLSATNATNYDINFQQAGTTNHGRIRFTEGASDFQFVPQVGQGPNLTLQYGGNSFFSRGNVGIGETTPDQKLNVREDGGSDVFRGIEVHNNDQSQARAGVCFKAYDWVQSAIWHGRTSTAAYAGALVLGTNPNTTDLTVSGVTGRMWILNNGDVGIATDQPTAKLDVNGTVRYRGSIYNQLAYQAVGNYAANTWHTFATSATLTQNGLYIIVAYIEDFTAGGSNYYTYAASTNFYWSVVGTNRTTAFNFPPMLGTGHATGVIPSIRITQELGTAGALSKLQWQSSYTYTNLQNAGGKILKFDLKRIGA